MSETVSTMMSVETAKKIICDVSESEAFSASVREACKLMLSKFAELEEKHENECRQISQYDEELRLAKSEIKLLYENSVSNNNIREDIDTFEITDEILSEINRYSRRTLTANDVYVFKIKICDNNFDSDRERYSSFALSDIESLLIGKTGRIKYGILDKPLIARILKTMIETDKTRVVDGNEYYTSLYACAFIVKSDGNENIENIVCAIENDKNRKATLSCGVSRNNGVLTQVFDVYEWNYTVNYDNTPEQPKNPKKSYKDDLFEKFPNVIFRELDCVFPCRGVLYGKDIDCENRNCIDCWNEAMKSANE